MTRLASIRTRSLIPACDVELERFEQIVRETAELPEVGAYKIGALLALAHGLPKVVETARRHTEKPLIYDHQKAGTDIPDTGKGFMDALARAGIDAVILFPFAGPTTQTAWVQAAEEANLDILVGAHMTHRNFIAADGGFLSSDAIERIFQVAANLGVKHYVVPGNNPEAITKIRGLVTEVQDPVFYAPGFVAQGGEISAAAEVAGNRWHAIVGRAIYEAANIRVAVETLARAIH